MLCHLTCANVLERMKLVRVDSNWAGKMDLLFENIASQNTANPVMPGRQGKQKHIVYLFTAIFLEQIHVPSGKRLHNYGKIHHFQWVNPLFLWPCSIAILT